MAKIRLQNVVKNYDKLNIIKNMNLEIHDGEFMVFVGPSGCAKSTTLRMIAGLEDISGGEVYIGNVLVNNLPPRHRNVSMVFQNYALYPHMNVAENLAFSLKIAKLSQATINKRVQQAVEILSINDLLDRLPAQLSGGQRQRVAMGRAIVRQPDAFLFDEPLSNLDAKLRTKMRSEIKKLHQRLKTTMIYVTHDQMEAMSLADRVVIMRAGHIEQVGTPMEVFTTPKNLFVAGFIGSPSMNFVTGTVAQGSLMLQNGDHMKLPNHIANICNDGQSITMGIRPESMVLQDQESIPNNTYAITVKPTVYEPLGNESLISYTYNGQEWTSRIFSTTPIATHTQCRLTFNRGMVHFFDTNTENRIG